MTWAVPLPGLARPHWLREGGGWLLAAATAALPLALALIWAGGPSGQLRGLDNVVMLDLAALPPVQAVAAPPLASPAPVDLPLPPEPAALSLPEPPPDLAPDLPPVVEAAEVSRPAPQPPLPGTRPKPRPKAAPKAKAAAPAPAAMAEAAAPQTAPAAASRKGNASVEASWGAAIRKKIERRKAYPKSAGGAAGRVTLRMTVARDGRLEAVAVALSSGNDALDQAALAAVQRAGRLPAAPRDFAAQSHRFTLPMDFTP